MRRTALFLILVVLAPALACAKREPLPGDSVATDGAVAVAPPRAASAPPVREPLGAIESRVFPPELIMEHQAELALTELQRKAIITESDRAQGEMTKLRWDLEREREALAKLLDAEPIDESATAVSAKRLTDLESKLKAVHLAMLVRIKNQLTPAQRTRLREVR
jgi:Spy/CpxP family protein refolding chaperone